MRLMGSKKPKPVETWDVLYDAALLQVKVNRLFNHARNESEEELPEKPSQEEVIGALKNAVSVQVWAMKNDQFADVVELIGKRHASGAKNKA